MDPEVLSKSQFHILLEMSRGNELVWNKPAHNGRYYLINKETRVFAEKPSSTRTVDSLLRQGFVSRFGDHLHITDDGIEKIEHESNAGVFK